MAEYYHHGHDDADTEEQKAYQREILAGQFGPGAPGTEEEEDNFATDRSVDGGARSHGGGHFGKKALEVLEYVGETVHSGARYFKIEKQVSKDLEDPNKFPEVAHVAYIRKGLDLSPQEHSFRAARKARMRESFARYMGWDPAVVHPDDVPTVAFGGSGGGYRAMLAMLGYSLAMKQTGLWDLLTYTAGVSGSCWAIAAYYTLGRGDVMKVIDHCKRRLSPLHPLSPGAVQKVLNIPRGDYETLGPIVQKRRNGLSTVAMDLYSVFTTGYLFYQEDPAIQPMGSAAAEVPGYHRAWWKWTEAVPLLQGGAEPLPILTAIRHERPWKNWADPEHPFADADPTAKEHREAEDAWWQWFELTPYEVGCDELAAWCPTWAFGRDFSEGRSIGSAPEQSLALLLGLCTSAPAGPLSSYLATIQRNLPKGFVGDSINKLASGVAKIWGKHETAIFENHHPLHASNEHNFVFHLTPTPPGVARPPGIENSPRIHLIDSGMDNNCPTYVMLHPARQVDVILNMDASSDVQKDTFPQRASQIGARRGIDFQKLRPDLKPGTDPADPDRFKGLYAQVYTGTPMAQKPETVVDSYGRTVTNPPAPPAARQPCTMVYLPLLPNERAAPGYDPSTAKFSGSYNLVWTPEQVDTIITTSAANLYDGHDTIREVLYNTYMRKRAAREQWEQQRQQQQPPPPPPPPPPPQQQQYAPGGPSQPQYA